MADVTATSIGNAIFMACRQLPEGYTIEVTLENGAATAECYDDEGEKISPEIGLGLDIDDEITEFIGMAHRHSVKRKGAHAMTLTAMILVGVWLLIFGYILGHMGGRESRKEAQKRGWTVLETLANGHNRQACRMIGAALEIESDGEDVGEYVEWACREAYIANEKASLEWQIAHLDKRRTSP